MSPLRAFLHLGLVQGRVEDFFIAVPEKVAKLGLEIHDESIPNMTMLAATNLFDKSKAVSHNVYLMPVPAAIVHSRGVIAAGNLRQPSALDRVDRVLLLDEQVGEEKPPFRPSPRRTLYVPPSRWTTSRWSRARSRWACLRTRRS